MLSAACSDDEPAVSSTTTEGGASGATIRVPEDEPTIQDAVDAAAPGDLVLVAPGTYNEAVDVETENLTIRGLDRNEVILDGGFELENGIRVLADGVAVENMTARNYTTNGFFWTGVTGYRGSYLTAFRNGDYGVYAFDSTKGQLEHIYASGSPDAGVYIGQCYPCDAVIDDVVSEYNGLGYSGTNSGGNLLIVNSTFRPQPGRHRAQQRLLRALLPGAGQHHRRQHRPRQQRSPTPRPSTWRCSRWATASSSPAANGNVIERNLVYDHERVGIGLVPFPEEEANDGVPDAVDVGHPLCRRPRRPACGHGPRRPRPGPLGRHAEPHRRQRGERLRPG